jgi:hypothetical protein
MRTTTDDERHVSRSRTRRLIAVHAELSTAAIARATQVKAGQMPVYTTCNRAAQQLPQYITTSRSTHSPLFLDIKVWHEHRFSSQFAFPHDAVDVREQGWETAGEVVQEPSW